MGKKKRGLAGHPNRGERRLKWETERHGKGVASTKIRDGAGQGLGAQKKETKKRCLVHGATSGSERSHRKQMVRFLAKRRLSNNHKGVTRDQRGSLPCHGEEKGGGEAHAKLERKGPEKRVAKS